MRGCEVTRRLAAACGRSPACGPAGRAHHVATAAQRRPAHRGEEAVAAAVGGAGAQRAAGPAGGAAEPERAVARPLRPVLTRPLTVYQPRARSLVVSAGHGEQQREQRGRRRRGAHLSRQGGGEAHAGRRAGRQGGLAGGGVSAAWAAVFMARIASLPRPSISATRGAARARATERGRATTSLQRGAREGGRTGRHPCEGRPRAARAVSPRRWRSGVGDTRRATRGTTGPLRTEPGSNLRSQNHPTATALSLTLAGRAPRVLQARYAATRASRGKTSRLSEQEEGL